MASCSRRVQAELKATVEALSLKELPWSRLDVMDSKMWRIYLDPSSFPQDLEEKDLSGISRWPGRELVAALEELSQVMILEIAFPPDYPLAPVFMRVVSPIFAPRTGHVTLGGAICSRLLTLDSWAPAMRVDVLVSGIVSEMVSCPYTMTPLGPSGPAQPIAGGEYRLRDAINAYVSFTRQHSWRPASTDYLLAFLGDVGEFVTVFPKSIEITSTLNTLNTTNTTSTPAHSRHMDFLVRSIESIVPRASAILPYSTFMNLESVAESSQEFKMISKRFKESMPDKKVLQLIAIRNPKREIEFLQYVLSTIEKSNVKTPKEINIAPLFHGATTPVNTRDIMNHGFEFRLCRSGASGRGTYFASDASYSSDYASHVPEGRCMIVARIALGRVGVIADSSTTLRPPDGYDSIKSFERNFVVFDNRAALPEFLLIF